MLTVSIAKVLLDRTFHLHAWFLAQNGALKCSSLRADFLRRSSYRALVLLLIALFLISFLFLWLCNIYTFPFLYHAPIFHNTLE